MAAGIFQKEQEEGNAQRAHSDNVPHIPDSAYTDVIERMSKMHADMRSNDFNVKIKQNNLLSKEDHQVIWTQKQKELQEASAALEENKKQLRERMAANNLAAGQAVEEEIMDRLSDCSEEAINYNPDDYIDQPKESRSAVDKKE